MGFKIESCEILGVANEEREIKETQIWNPKFHVILSTTKQIAVREFVRVGKERDETKMRIFDRKELYGSFWPEPVFEQIGKVKLVLFNLPS